MKKNLFPTLLALAALLFSSLACRSAGPLNINKITGSGQVKTETRPVSGFENLDLSGIGEVTLTQGDEESLEIEAEDNLLPYIETKVMKGTLYISIQDGVNIEPTQPIRYNLTMKTVLGISSSGLGDIRAGDLHTRQLAISMSGLGGVYIASLFGEELETQTSASYLEVNMSGVGDCQIDGGLVKDQALDLSGAGSYNAPDLQSQTAQVNLSGVGGVTLWVINELRGDISGAGSLSYYGSPSTQIDKSGIGGVDSLGEK